MRRAIFLILAAVLCARAQQPRLENARLETRPVAGNLESTMRTLLAAQSSPAWIGYAVAVVPGDRQMCGWDNGRSTSHHLSLEGATTMFVLYRAEQQAITRLRLATPDCDIDAGGLPVIWLTGVDAGERVRYLQSLTGASRIGDPALLAISLHNHPSAIPALVRTAREDKSAHVRGQALFWLAQSAQRKLALDTAAAAIENDPELAATTDLFVTSDHGFDSDMETQKDAPFVFLATNDARVGGNGKRQDITPTILARWGADISKIQPSLDGKSLLK